MDGGYFERKPIGKKGANDLQSDHQSGNMAEVRDIVNVMGKAASVSSHNNLEFMMMLRSRKNSRVLNTVSKGGAGSDDLEESRSYD